MNNRKKYNDTMGLLQVIGIIMVIMGHMGCNILTIDNFFPYYSFHMPLFVFISGYFYKQENELNLGGFILRKAKSLLLPFYIWSLVYLLIQTFIFKYNFTLGWTFSFKNWLLRPWTHDQAAGFYVACWFLIALFLTEVIYITIRSAYRFISRKSNIKKQWIFDVTILIVFLALSSFVIRYRLRHDFNGWKLVLFRSVFLLLFFHVGYCYKTYLEKWDTMPNIAYLLICGAIRGALFIKGSCDFGTYNVSFTQLPFYTLTAAFVGIAFWLRVARIFSVATKDSKLVKYCSEHTKDCVIHHMFVLFIISLFCYAVHQKTNLLGDFNIQAFKSDVYYKYVPFSQFRLLYTLATLGGSLLIAKITECTKGLSLKLLRKMIKKA